MKRNPIQGIIFRQAPAIYKFAIIIIYQHLASKEIQDINQLLVIIYLNIFRRDIFLRPLPFSSDLTNEFSVFGKFIYLSIRYNP